MYLTGLELMLLAVVAYLIGLLTTAVVGYYAAKLTLRMTGKGEQLLKKPTPSANQSGRPVEADDVSSTTPDKAGKPKT